MLPLVGAIDGRTRSALAFKSAVADIVSDLGGQSAISRAQLELVRRAAGLAVLASTHEASIIAGDEVDCERYIAVCNAQGRALTRLGLQRTQRDVTFADNGQRAVLKRLTDAELHKLEAIYTQAADRVVE